MKKHKSIYIALLLMIVMGSCKQEVITLKDQPVITPPTPDKGSADFTKFVAIGSSYVAGMQGGALFDAGQANSLAAILNKQFQSVGAPATFNQPDINATLGYNIFISPNPGADNHVLGRMLLQGADPVPTPQPYALGDLSAVPNPQVNPGFMFTGNKAALQNFAVEAITLGQFLIPNTGNWADPNPAHGFSPFYARFASNPGTSTIIGDAATAGGSFFLFWCGMDDFMLYAAYGGDGTKAPLTSSGAFTAQYGAAIGALLGSNPNLKGVVANFPNIFYMPHFTAVPWNAIPLDGATASAVNSELSVNYNAFLAAMVTNQIMTQDEATKRHINFAAGQNAQLISDETLTDLSPYMAGPYAGLLPYARARQATSSDIFPLAAGSILGTLVNNDPNLIYGVTVPLPDQYALIPSEIAEISTARTAFNATVAATVEANSAKLALADVSGALDQLVQNQFAVKNNVTITPNINPPTGIYSEDGIHPNSRGYAFIANVIINSVAAKFSAVIPEANLGLYPATGLPIP